MIHSFSKNAGRLHGLESAAGLLTAIPG